MELGSLHNKLNNVEYEVGIDGLGYEVLVCDEFDNIYSIDNIYVEDGEIIIKISDY